MFDNTPKPFGTVLNDLDFGRKLAKVRAELEHGRQIFAKIEAKLPPYIALDILTSRAKPPKLYLVVKTQATRMYLLRSSAMLLQAIQESSPQITEIEIKITPQ